MLQIQDIHKHYVTGELVQTALDGVSLNLRDNEFVAILGPSGSGKTTLLNVIGGLDRYDSGDLIINGISTKKYTDRDWDSYRNHTVGFVFQSYNLIPHQTVLANVELALTISGISGAERKRRATQALTDVGLGNQLHKRPNQMSGGQMQRVAIARALVNDPDILLADEPTGALDSETSIQVMDLLKEVSRKRLVVMVTHNPELAEAYANRIVRVKDGRILSDSNPFAPDSDVQKEPEHRNMGRASMSFLTALVLSFNNLRTKKGRTLLTAFAGSIGIIGIALIVALSTGFKLYIDKIQEDTLSNYPLMLQSETASMNPGMMGMHMGLRLPEKPEDGTVMEHQTVAGMFSQIGSNDLGAFKKYLDEHYDSISQAITEIKYDYGVKPRIYVGNTENGVVQSNPSTVFDKVMGESVMTSFMIMDVFQEMMDNRELLENQYDVVQGRWPQSYNEMVVVLEKSNRITDYTAYCLGLKDRQILDQMVDRIMKGQEIEADPGQMEWTYDDIMNLDLRLVPVSELYRHNREYDVWEDMSQNEKYMRNLIADSEQLRIVGIIVAKDDNNGASLMPGVAYTSDLTRHVMDIAKNSQIVKNQLENPELNVFTGTGFNEKNASEIDFEDMISVDKNAISSSFGVNINENELMNFLNQKMNEALGNINVDRGPAQQDFVSTLSVLCRQMLEKYVQEHGNETGTARVYLRDGEKIVDAYLASPQALQQIGQLSEKYGLPTDSLVQVYRPLIVGMIAETVASSMDDLLPEIPPETQPQPEETTAPAENTQPEETTAPAENTQPEETTAPAENTQPEETTAPEENTQPEETTAPAENTQPEETTAPAENIQPEETTILAESSNSLVSQEAVRVISSPRIPEVDTALFHADLKMEQIDGIVDSYLTNPMVIGTAEAMSAKMMEGTIQEALGHQLAGIGRHLMKYIGNSMTVDEEKLSSAFRFNMEEEELHRLMETMYADNLDKTAAGNLRMLGCGDLEQPVAMSFYLRDFESKEDFVSFLDQYNQKMTDDGHEDQVIRYTDFTGMMMSSVKIIIDSISYALIAFVGVSLVVSSIMIGIITYISVMERTKEIGILRAIGASKRNISQVFNAETFIIGLCSGLIGIGITLLLLIPGNHLIQSLTGNPDIVAQLPISGALVLILLSMLLTLLGGLIPSKQAARKDPVIALRSE